MASIPFTVRPQGHQVCSAHAVVQELDLSSNQLEGPIPEGWRLPENLTVSMISSSLLRMLVRCKAHCARSSLYRFAVRNIV